MIGHCDWIYPSLARMGPLVYLDSSSRHWLVLQMIRRISISICYIHSTVSTCMALKSVYIKRRNLTVINRPLFKLIFHSSILHSSSSLHFSSFLRLTSTFPVFVSTKDLACSELA